MCHAVRQIRFLKSALVGASLARKAQQRPKKLGATAHLATIHVNTGTGREGSMGTVPAAVKPESLPPICQDEPLTHRCCLGAFLTGQYCIG